MPSSQSNSQPGSPAMSALPGDMYDMPTHTWLYEQPDLNSGIITTLAGATASPMIGQVSFRQVDIVRYWRMRSFISNVIITSGGTLHTVSQYAPYNFIGQIQLSANNMYNIVDLQSGIDLAIFNAYRPVRRGWGSSTLYTAPREWPYAVGEAIFAGRPAAANTSVSPPAALTEPTAATSYMLDLYLPVSLRMDEYYDIDFATGLPRAVGHNVDVTPLNMGIQARDVIPYITYNPVLGATTDAGPFVETGSGAGFTSGQAKTYFRRLGSYNSTNPEDLPPEYEWRYALVSKRFSLSGVSSVNIPMKSVIGNNTAGQLLSVWVRFYDPAAASGAGAAISLGSITATAETYVVTNGQLQIGSSQVRYNDDPADMQARVFEQHDLNLPIGVWLWDLAVGEEGIITNKGAINLYTTDVTLSFSFNAALSSSAYCVVGSELLTHVAPAGQ